MNQTTVIILRTLVSVIYHRNAFWCLKRDLPFKTDYCVHNNTECTIFYYLCWESLLLLLSFAFFNIVQILFHRNPVQIWSPLDLFNRENVKRCAMALHSLTRQFLGIRCHGNGRKEAIVYYPNPTVGWLYEGFDLMVNSVPISLTITCHHRKALLCVCVCVWQTPSSL